MPDIIQRFRPLFYPDSVAMFGATNDIRKWGFALFHNLLKGGYDKPIYPIHPRKSEILGIKAYHSLEETPGEVDLAIITIPPGAALDAIGQCARKGVRAAVVNTAGFGETGERGLEMEREAAKLAKGAGMAMLGPNCQGVMSADARLFPQMMGVYPPGGRISLVSQSGNIGGNMMAWGQKWNVHFNKFISVGNEAVSTCADMIDYLGADPATRVIAVYIEGVKDGAHFMASVKGASASKPVLLLKGGRTDAGGSAAKSHTGSMAGRSDIFDGACRQAGAILVDSLEEMFDMAAVFSSQPLPGGESVAMITHGGGWGVIAADMAQKSGLQVVELPRKAIAELDKILPDRWSRANPVDLAAGGGRGVVEKVVDALINLPQVDALLMLGIGSAAIFKRNISGTAYHDPERVAQLCARAEEIEEKAVIYSIGAGKNSNKPVISCSDVVGSLYETDSAALNAMRRNGMVLFPSPERCVKALAGMVDYSRWRNWRR